MQNTSFRLQVERLKKVFDKKYYADERISLLWRAFQHADDMLFAEAIDDLIANKKSAPLLDDINEALEEVRVRDRERRRMGNRNMVQLLEDARDAAVSEKTREFARQCIRILHEKLTGQLSAEQFIEGCNMLEMAATREYPDLCARCSNTGFVLVRNGAYDYLHRCGCGRGRAQPEELIMTRADGTTENAKVPFAKIGVCT